MDRRRNRGSLARSRIGGHNTCNTPEAGTQERGFPVTGKDWPIWEGTFVKTGREAHLRPIGVIRSIIRKRKEAPRLGGEGAPDAWLELSPHAARGLDGILAGDDIIVVTWLHRARREVLKVYPRADRRRRLTGVFATRSPDRPNPLGLHRVTVRSIAGNRLRIGPIEAIDGTPVVDIKPVLPGIRDF